MPLGTNTEGMYAESFFLPRATPKKTRPAARPTPASPLSLATTPGITVSPNKPGPNTDTIGNFPGFSGPLPFGPSATASTPTASTPTANPLSLDVTVGPNSPGPNTETVGNFPGFVGPLPLGSRTKEADVVEGVLKRFLGSFTAPQVPTISGGASGQSFLSNITNSFSRVPTAPGSKLGFRRNKSDENDRIRTSTRGVVDNADVRRKKAGGRNNKAKGTV
jgi:hypothetical protein